MLTTEDKIRIHNSLGKEYSPDIFDWLLDRPELFFLLFLLAGAVKLAYFLYSEERKNETLEKTKENEEKLKELQEKPYIKEYSGTVFENISGSTIIHESTVINSLNSIKETTDPEFTDALIQLGDLINKENNATAAELYEEFITTLDKSPEKKSVLKTFWDEIVSQVPAVNSMVDLVERISKIIA